MKTDYQQTGKLYKELEAYTLGTGAQAMPNPRSWYYFGTSAQFKSCKNFKAFLENKHAGHKFKVVKSR
jgi:hypothetical protein